MVIALTGAGLTAWTWYTALHGNYFNQRAAMVSPSFLIVGIGLMIFPGYREERLSSGKDISWFHGYRLITPRWWVILIVGLAAGGLNFLLLSLLLD
jgi:hypothetical protein